MLLTVNSKKYFKDSKRIENKIFYSCICEALVKLEDMYDKVNLCGSCVCTAQYSM